MRKTASLILFLSIIVNACSPVSLQPNGTPGSFGMPNMLSSTPTAPDYIEARQDQLWVRVIYPKEGSIIKQNQVDISGQATPGALLNINTQQMLVPPDQFFRVTLPLQPGSNIIQISASDSSDNSIQITLTVTFTP